jgi:hypothetical protein
MDSKSIASVHGDFEDGRGGITPKALGHSIRQAVALRTFDIVKAHCPGLAIEESLVTGYLKDTVCGTGCEAPEDFLSHALSSSGLARQLWEGLLEQFAFASGMRFPFLGFADRMAVPIEFYTQEGDIAELCRLLQTPVLQAESGCFLTLASINPVTAEALSAEIVRIFRSRGLLIPVIFPVRTDFESWQCLCRRHFAA